MRAGAGTNTIDVEAASEVGIYVTNVPGRNAIAVAELTMGLLLAIDPILDMGRTAVNVAGQALVPTIVAKRNGLLEPTSANPSQQIPASSTTAPA